MEIKKHNFANKILSAWVLAILVVGFPFFYFYQSAITPERHDKIFCTQEAKQCPDGSYVSRTGPNCEFAYCPKQGLGQEDVSTWKTYRNEKYGFEVSYPREWIIEEIRDGVFVVSDKPISFSKGSNPVILNRSYFVMNHYDFKNKKSNLREWILNDFGGTMFIGPRFEIIKLGENEVTKFTAENNPGFTHYFIFDRDAIFEFDDDEGRHPDEDILKRILSTFRFLK